LTGKGKDIRAVCPRETHLIVGTFEGTIEIIKITKGGLIHAKSIDTAVNNSIYSI